MAMVVDMILAVAVVTAAAGAVTKFQIRIAHIGAAADDTSVGIGCLGFCGGCFVRACVGEGDDLGLFLTGAVGLFPEEAAGIGTPGTGEHVQHIWAEEQEVVCKRNHGEAVVGEGIGQQAVQYQRQIYQRKDPCLHRNDEEQKELRVREHGGIAEEQTQVQISYISLTAKDHAPDIHQHNAGEVEQIETQSTPDILHGTAEGIITEKTHSHQKHIAVIESQRIADQSPDLTMKDRGTVKNQQGIEQGIPGDLCHQVH